MSGAPPERPLGREGFTHLFPVSRETLACLEAHLALLERWQRRIELVGRSTLADPWRRHLLDSAQLRPLIPEGARRLVDLGSGAGFPGLVLAILGVPEVHLIEADRRKAAFLREAARVTGCRNVVVHARRIEELDPFPADVVTARAFAPLDRLLACARRFWRPGTLGLFLKGRGVERELTAAREHWRMRAELRPSLSSPEGRILLVHELEPIDG